jgi:hypothetical protein
MTENKRYEFDVMNGGGYVVGYFERMSDDISFFTRLCEVPTKRQAEKVCNELKGLQKENEQLKADNNRLVNKTAKIVAEHQNKVLNLINAKIQHYQKQPLLTVRIPIDCVHKKSCLHNQEVNVCNKAKENAYRELKKELQE